MLSDLLQISENIPQIVSLIGAGGKTSIMFELAKELKQKNCRVLVTTTTKIYYPEPDKSWDTYFLPLPQNFSPKAGSITIIGKYLDEKANKIIGLDFKEIKRLSPQFDTIIIEADGSKQKALKFPGTGEPVIHPDSNMVIGIIGLSCLGKAINSDNVHRHLLFAESLGYSENQIIQLDMLIDLINHPLGLFKNTPINSRKICILNQLDQQPEISIIKNKIIDNHHLLSGIEEIYLSGKNQQHRYWLKTLHTGQ